MGDYRNEYRHGSAQDVDQGVSDNELDNLGERSSAISNHASFEAEQHKVPKENN